MAEESKRDELDRLSDEIEEFHATGGDINTPEYAKMAARLEELQQELGLIEDPGDIDD